MTITAEGQKLKLRVEKVDFPFGRLLLCPGEAVREQQEGQQEG
jgi:hypothetical protein